ncbi:MAG TPA: hypothetical protein VFX97_03265 [Pyrinomonadaceae bacterium]|nr:hypothetical protein [Pyrinomonadaceae bacterium]
MVPFAWKRSVVVLLLLCFFMTLAPQPAQACGPFFTDAIFVFQKHPDHPLEKFARGNVGVLQPTYARSYLVAAYRNLIGETLSDAEVKGLTGLWDDRLNNSWDETSEDWLKKWKDARAKVPGVGAPPDIDVYRYREKPQDYEAFLNCQADAFQNAVATLDERTKSWGADSAAMRDWITAQDIVFKNCKMGQEVPPAASEQNALLRADRAYQIAAANFYATKFDDAVKSFDAIADDGSSPWRTIAPYLAARSLLRKGSLAAEAEQGKPALAQAEKRLKTIVDDRKLEKSHHAANRLLNLTRLRLRPEETVRNLAQTISKKGAATDFKQSVWDYTVLLDKWILDNEDGVVKSTSVPATVRTDELTDWIVTFQDESDAATTHANEQWGKKQNLPWLVAAIAKADGPSAKANDLISAAARVEFTSPAAPTLIFNRARLLAEMNRGDEARTLLDETLAGDRTKLTRSGANLLLSERMMLARNLNEFLRAAQREAAGFSDNSDERERPMEEKEAAEYTRGSKVFFDADAATVFNKLMPVALWADAARSDLLPANLQRNVAQASFMRAALTDRAAVANQTATTMAAAYPEAKELLTAYQRATTPDARRFAAAYLALKFPGLRPYVTFGVGRGTDIAEMDSYRDNWWCAEPPTSFGGYFSEGGDATKKQMPSPEFLKPSRAAAEREAALIQSLGPGPNYLAQTAVNWATTNPTDRRVPEALHLAVKSTRYGCTDKETGRWSKAAFDLLRRKYPNSTWAKQTPYWFKG